MRNDYGYILNQVVTEFDRIIQNNSEIYQKHFVDFSEKNNYILTDVHTLLN